MNHIILYFTFRTIIWCFPSYHPLRSFRCSSSIRLTVPASAPRRAELPAALLSHRGTVPHRTYTLHRLWVSVLLHVSAAQWRLAVSSMVYSRCVLTGEADGRKSCSTSLTATFCPSAAASIYAGKMLHRKDNSDEGGTWQSKFKLGQFKLYVNSCTLETLMPGLWSRVGELKRHR